MRYLPGVDLRNQWDLVGVAVLASAMVGTIIGGFLLGAPVRSVGLIVNALTVGAVLLMIVRMIRHRCEFRALDRELDESKRALNEWWVALDGYRERIERIVAEVCRRQGRAKSSG